MEDPDMGFALASRLLGQETVWLPDMYASTILYFEPDITNKYVIDAWIIGNMFPKTAPEITAKRDLQAAKEDKQVDIEFAALTLSTDAVRKMAQEVLNNLTIFDIDPQNIAPFVDSSTVNEMRQDLENDFNKNFRGELK